MILAGDTLVDGSYSSDAIGYTLELTIRSSELDDTQLIALSDSINNANIRVVFTDDNSQTFLGRCAYFVWDLPTGCLVSLVGCVKL